MRKILSLLLAAALLLLALAGCSQAQEEEPLPESIEINFFYNEPCGACHDQINDFYDMFNTQLEDVKDKYPYDLQAYNVFQASASDKMYTVLEGLGYPEELISSLTYPILTINGKAYLGDRLHPGVAAGGVPHRRGGLVRKRPRRVRPPGGAHRGPAAGGLPLEKGSATVVYFYRLTCEECIQTEEEFMDTLPEQVEVDGKSYPLQVVRINTRSGSNNEILQAFSRRTRCRRRTRWCPLSSPPRATWRGMRTSPRTYCPSWRQAPG